MSRLEIRTIVFFFCAANKLFVFIKQWSKYLKGKGRKVFSATVSTVFSSELQVTLLYVIGLMVSSEEAVL